jgi:hypothetical protein
MNEVGDGGKDARDVERDGGPNADDRCALSSSSVGRSSVGSVIPAEAPTSRSCWVFGFPPACWQKH